MRASRLLPDRLRRFLLSLAEIGHESNRDLKLAFMAERRSLFVDVGANRGQFARFVSSFYARVVVFEPIERFGRELGTILAPNCTIHGCALADFSGPATFYVPDEENPMATQTASLIAPSAAMPRIEITVEVKRLDDFALDDVSFIKVDIEGAEYGFLRGAVATLERCRPVLLIEIEDRHTGGNTRRVFDLLFGLGYRVFILGEPGGRLRSSVLFRLIRGVAYASGLRKIPLIPVDDLIARIGASPHGLNRAFGTGYVNNFLFVPR